MAIFQIKVPEVFCKTDALKKFVLQKRLCQCVFFNKITGPQLATFFKKEICAQVFSCESCKFLRPTILQNVYQRLVLVYIIFCLLAVLPQKLSVHRTNWKLKMLRLEPKVIAKSGKKRNWCNKSSFRNLIDFTLINLMRYTHCRRCNILWI